MFSAFSGSSMPKRLLRHALSRLDLLDTDAIDIDNLDLAIGRNTVLEFRDVGLKLEKLERLLQLPPALQVRRARVSLLRLSIPMNLYTSPISASVVGANVWLSLINEDGAADDTQPSDELLVPNAVDLAQSFLDMQSFTEKKELEQVLSGDKANPSGEESDDDNSETESSFGTGQPLSLPGFLAGFIQGVVDRVEVSISDVTFRFEAEVPAQLNSTQLETASFVLKLDSIDVEGVTSKSTSAAAAAAAAAATVSKDDSVSADAPDITKREGKRHVVLNKLRAYLVSDPRVFSLFSTSSPPSGLPTNVLRQGSSFMAGPDVSSYHGEDFLTGSPAISNHSLDRLPSMDSVEDQSATPDDDPTTPRQSAANLVDTDLHLSVQGLPPLLVTGDDGSPCGSIHSQGQSSQQGSINLLLSDDDESTDDQGLHSLADLPRSESSSENGDDLTQSRMFTHEDAESLYMSAASLGNTGESQHSTHPWAPEGNEDIEEPAFAPLTNTEDISGPLANMSLRDLDPSGPSEPNVYKRSVPFEDLASSTYVKSISMPGGFGSWGEEPNVYGGISQIESNSPRGRSTSLEDMDAPPTPKIIPGTINQDALILDVDDSSAPTPTTGRPQRPPSPEGPIKSAKEILSLDKISIFLPSQLLPVPDVPGSSEGETEADVKLAASIAGATGSIYNPFEILAEIDLNNYNPHLPPSAKDPDSVDVEISSIELRFDVSLGFIISSMVSKLLGAFESTQTPTKPLKRATNVNNVVSNTVSSSVKVALAQVSLILVNNVRAFETPYSRITIPSEFKSTSDQDVLLWTDIKDIKTNSETDNSGSHGNLSIGKVNFGYSAHPKDDIIKFEYQAILQASIRDAFPEKGADIEVSFSQTKDETRTKVLTLPLCINLDLPKLDGLLNRFDGIPGIASMISTMYNHMPSRPSQDIATPRPKQKSKGVRFDEVETFESGPKTDVRVGGTRTRIISQSCRLDLDTTSLKAALRDQGLALSCTKIQFTGPRTAHSHSAAITASFHESRIEFFNVPKETDISRLFDILVPNASKFPSENEILIDTLFSQRRNGPILRAKTKMVQLRVSNISQLECLTEFGKEVSKFAEVAKYLPEDDRPGILTIADVDDVQISAELGDKIGTLHSTLKATEVAHVGFPALLSVGIGSVYVDRNGDEVLVDSIRNIAVPTLSKKSGLAVRIQMVGDQPEPVVKIRLQDTAVEYRVPMLLDVMGLEKDATPEQFEASLAASVANLGDVANAASINLDTLTELKSKEKTKKPLAIDLAFRDVLIGLNPLNVPSKMYAAVHDCRVRATVPEDGDFIAQLEVGKAWLMLTDNTSHLATLDELDENKEDHAESWLTTGLSKRGFVQISYISSAIATVKSHRLPESDARQMFVNMSETLVILETCADSMQTLISLGNALSPPSPPSTEVKYRTAMEVQDLLASISGEAFGRAEGDYDFEQDFGHVPNYEGTDSDYEDLSMAGSTADLHSVFPEDHGGSLGHHYPQAMMRGEKLFDATTLMTDSVTTTQDTHDGILLGVQSQDLEPEEEYGHSSELLIQSNFFEKKDDVAEHVRLWDTARGRYLPAPKSLVRQSPVLIEVRNVRVFWNLFDGYDWDTTRDVITEAVKGVQTKAMERQQREYGQDGVPDMDDNTEIGDFLFNSIYIGISTNQDPRELAGAINRELGDTAETESVITSMTQNSNSTIRASGNRRSSRALTGQPQLKLGRSKHHKISFEAVGIDADINMLPPASGPTQSCIDVRVKSLDIIDHLPQSTWRKFATYDRDAGERELDASQIHVELLNIKPVADLAASEFVVQVQVLPLRLHVDQDALDFLMRFFAFKDKDESIPQSRQSDPGDVPFVSRFEIQCIPVKLDFKPRRVDYAALRSGKTSEFMNFVTLQDTRIELRRIMLHGVMGFDKVGQMLNDLWTPDVTKTQLSTVLAGLSVVRPLADVGSGVCDLIEVPMAEYKKDGRIFRSIKKGAVQFARNTGTNVIKLGAKVAVGTQSALEGAEGLLTKNAQRRSILSGGHTGSNDEPARVISPYANQPLGVVQGLRGGYSSLTRDVMLAKDAIVAVSTQVLESEGAAGAAKAVLLAAPTIIFRPAIGASKAIGQTLLGVTNTLDPANKRRVEDKYKQ